MYVPANASEIVLEDRSGSTPGTADEWAIFDNYISNDDYLRTRRGKYAERNASRGPWSHIVDLKLLQDISFAATCNRMILSLVTTSVVCPCTTVAKKKKTKNARIAVMCSK